MRMIVTIITIIYLQSLFLHIIITYHELSSISIIINIYNHYQHYIRLPSLSFVVVMIFIVTVDRYHHDHIASYHHYDHHHDSDYASYACDDSWMLSAQWYQPTTLAFPQYLKIGSLRNYPTLLSTCRLPASLFILLQDFLPEGLGISQWQCQMVSCKPILFDGMQHQFLQDTTITHRFSSGWKAWKNMAKRQILRMSPLRFPSSTMMKSDKAWCIRCTWGWPSKKGEWLLALDALNMALQ